MALGAKSETSTTYKDCQYPTARPMYILRVLDSRFLAQPLEGMRDGWSAHPFAHWFGAMSQATPHSHRKQSC